MVKQMQPQLQLQLRHWLLTILLSVAGLVVAGEETGYGTASKPVSQTATQTASATATHPRVVGALDLIDHWLDARQGYRQIPGVSVGVVLDQDLIFSRGYGFANVKRKRPATPDTLYSICSISKLFTSIGVMQQRDAGRLRLSDPVAQHLDWFEVPPAGSGRPVTIGAVLTHSSGLPRESDFPYWTGPEFAFPGRAQVMERLRSQEALYPADTYFQYSNLGLTLAGEVVAAASGEPYADYVRGRILDPLGLGDTRPSFPQELHGKRLAVGYSARHRDGHRDVVRPFDARGITPAAGFTSNVTDLAEFAAWQFRLLEEGGTEVLDADTLREMHRVHWVDPDWKVTWGIGFVVSKTDFGTEVGHGGSCPGYLTSFSMLPARTLAVIVMMNASGEDPRGVSQAVYKTLVPALEAAKAGSADETTPDFSAYAGVYDAQPWGSEIAVVQWGDRLAVAGLPSPDPMRDLIKLKHESGHEFRRVRESDDNAPGELWRFAVDDSGVVTGFERHSNFRPRLR